jgi:hypothetical protein
MGFFTLFWLVGMAVGNEVYIKNIYILKRGEIIKE